MEDEVTCPFCFTEFVAITFENGECPECGESYCWECDTYSGFDSFYVTFERSENEKT
jgi:hypothetical protein